MSGPSRLCALDRDGIAGNVQIHCSHAPGRILVLGCGITAVIASLAVSLWPRDGAVRKELGSDKRLHFFGEVLQNQTVESAFRLVNNADSTIRIRGIVTDCGCTTGIVEKRTIGVGEHLILRVQLKTGRSRGRIKRRVIVSYVRAADGGAQVKRTLVLGLCADVQPEFRVRPETLIFAKSAAAQQKIVVSPGTLKTGVVRNAYSTHEAFKASVRTVADDPRSFVITVAFDPSRWDGGPSDSTTVIVETNGRVEGRLPIRVRVE